MDPSSRSNAFAPLNLAQCEREPIHTPGAIQPHGAFVAMLSNRLLVTHASANLAAVLGVSPHDILGKPLGSVFSEVAHHLLEGAKIQDVSPYGRDSSFSQTLSGPNGRPMHLRSHRLDRHICVDIQPILPEAPPEQNSGELRKALETFARATRSAELCALAVRALKAVTGYDRVMAYKFHADGHGEVIAEACESSVEPFLGLHYPASDIPSVARQLFLRQRVCLIADTAYSPVPIVVDPALDDGAPLDLSLSSLRSVSPVHREYLRNMKVGGSLSVALVKKEDPNSETLWGMLVCHAEAPRVAGPELQAVVGMLGQVVSILIRSLDEAQFYSDRLRRNATLRGLVQRISVASLPPHGLAGVEDELLDLVGASGALIKVADSTISLGHTPPTPFAQQALDTLRREGGGDVLAIDDLGLRYPDLGGCTSEGSGALFMSLPHTPDSAILWFRPERVQSVAWAGNPHEYAISHPVTGRLSPRDSFALWKEIERGRSEPWTGVDLAVARELRSSVELAMADRTRADLARLRHYDPLTGLPNRSLLEERICDNGRGARQGWAVIFLDLDGFKAVNDTMGHAAGDALLLEVATRLRTVAGPGNIAARLGGDEFVILKEALDGVAIPLLGEEVRLAIEEPINISGRYCRVTSSIGIAIAGETSGLDLIRAADMAMYAAKQAGGNRVVMFEPSLFDRASLRFELEEDMRVALARGDQFVLLYQPIFDVTFRTKRLAGFEALVRWNHPRHGWMSPGLFIPLAEKSGLVLPLGDWVLTTALRQASVLRRADPSANLTMNVNVSVCQLPQSGYCDGVAARLQAESYPPSALCLEVVESLLADGAAARVLADIRKLGVLVAIDDFGIGYSSLSYLHRLPVDKVKLDRSFLEDIEGDPRGAKFVGAVISLAHAAGKPVVFEGIETTAQFDIAVGAGANLVQGFFLAPPLSANASEDFVVRHRQAAS